MDIPLFIVCICYGITHTQKNCILVVKQITWFYSIQCYTQNKTIPPKNGKLFNWILALSCNECDARCEAPVIWWGWNLAISFLEKINPFFFNIFHMTFHICVFLFSGCTCTISICVTDNQHAYSDWMTAISMNADRPLWTVCPYLYDYDLYYCTSACDSMITDYWQQSVCGCLAKSGYVWQSEYVCEYVQHTKQFFFSFFLFITQMILIVFFSGQINHLYDV